MRRFFGILLALALVLTACAKAPPAQSLPAAGDPTEARAPAQPPTEPPTDPDAIAARVGDRVLTNRELTLYYRMALTDALNGDISPAPGLPLDRQRYDEDTTWEECLLHRALETWHTRQALALQSEQAEIALDPEFQAIELHHANIAPDMPVMEVLYGASTKYAPDEMLQAWIDDLPLVTEPLAGYVDGDLLSYARLMNLAYAYYVNLERELTLSQEELDSCTAEGAPLVTFRHILLPCCGESPWTEGAESDFALLASRISLDDGSARAGGLYQNITQGQMLDALDSWLFDPARQAGDTVQLDTELGSHLVYFVSRDSSDALAEREALLNGHRLALFAAAREEYPMTVDWEAIGITEQEALPFSDSDLLYPDIAHERYSRIPVYLQHDFPDTWYKGLSLSKTGCGLTNMAMLASYMTDTTLTPPEIARRYAEKYTLDTGTDVRLFEDIPQTLGFYWIRRTYDMEEVRQALREGFLVVNLQHKGYFTRDGHYMILYGIDDKDRVSICDSNIFNYARLKEHRDNRFPFAEFLNHSLLSIIFQPKVTRIPACWRCGGETGVSPPEGLLNADYTCPKCAAALARREAFLGLGTITNPGQ